MTRTNTSFTLSSGFEVQLHSLQVGFTFAGLIEGDPAKIPDFLRRRDGSLVPSERYSLGLAENKPFVLFDPGGSFLPDLRWLGYFRSHKAVKEDDPDFISHLYYRGDAV